MGIGNLNGRILNQNAGPAARAIQIFDQQLQGEVQLRKRLQQHNREMLRVIEWLVADQGGLVEIPLGDLEGALPALRLSVMPNVDLGKLFLNIIPATHTKVQVSEAPVEQTKGQGESAG